ncbi:hypothetical protein R4282_18795 [Rhodococcus oxybenzonivorans]|jgi:Mce-associated membrane protein|uniref:hypothetical protein n=1 Tax=Rhodococcus TaxID=1827 RepID=UPI00131F8285|nr:MULTISPECIES: hypothetical protein [Rhodococcus]MDV7355046.1 hypothetical protein [Rhodococcus oxybenzonivorans]QHE68985.1 hypothetical protein GFS60_02536 [Rhodococcus sp. WAY2]
MIKVVKTAAVPLVLVAVAAIFAVLAVFQFAAHRAAEAARAEDAVILGAANSGLNAMLSVRESSAAEDVRNVLDHSTGAFAKDFEARSSSFVSVVQAAKVVTQGQVVAAGIESRNGDSATVIVAASSTVTNAAGAANESRNWRLRVTMTEHEGTYKMSKVDFVA